jgi:hypothetical protein
MQAGPSILRPNPVEACKFTTIYHNISVEISRRKIVYLCILSVWRIRNMTSEQREFEAVCMYCGKSVGTDGDTDDGEFFQCGSCRKKAEIGRQAILLGYGAFEEEILSLPSHGLGSLGHQLTACVG